ncbi:hypothetical protein [Shewanella mesophila]|nr:hypothetical protein [Shewanella mesophila]
MLNEIKRVLTLASDKIPLIGRTPLSIERKDNAEVVWYGYVSG